ncbi:hypothetical protein JW935_22730 [candidate division KSB1 bacterium]|nr:hypothetical protein [candidate division KSB1 bacterium]
MKNKSNTLIIGVIFIFVGFSLLLDRLNAVQFSWDKLFPILLLLLAVILWAKSINGNYNSVGWATFFSVLGAFYFLRNYDVIEHLWFSDVWPVVILAMGMSFLVKYAFRPAEWGLLIPAFFLILVGVLFFLDDMNITYEYTHYFLSNIWALLLVILGGGLIISALRRRVQDENKSGSSTDIKETGP